jgi:hypothetical protein
MFAFLIVFDPTQQYLLRPWLPLAPKFGVMLKDSDAADSKWSKMKGLLCHATIANAVIRVILKDSDAADSEWSKHAR